ncbi:MAG: exodeoxyribonuclease VII large subunit [Methanotrichaceae archaeon]
MNRIFDVSELNARINDRLTSDSRLNDLWVRGELSNVVNHRSGHRYFTLNEKNSQISCVLFRNYGRKLDFELRDGLNALVFGDVGFYQPRGQVQILVRAVKLDSGLGLRHEELEMLKRKLSAEGLFDIERKRQLPLYPQRIGIVTSLDGAALRDVIRILEPYPAKIIISPAQVQGDSAPDSIAAAIEGLKGRADVMIVCRGGGSAEDLWPFNSEIVARAIYQSDCPVISAVGHETDVTIADFVADVRSPTPSAASDLVKPDVAQLKLELQETESNMAKSLIATLERKHSRLAILENGLSSRVLLNKASKERHRLDQLSERLLSTQTKRVEYLRNRLDLIEGQLSSLSPLATLSRGYVIARSDGNVIRTAVEVEPEDLVELIFLDGRLECKVVEKRLEDGRDGFRG